MNLLNNQKVVNAGKGKDSGKSNKATSKAPTPVFGGKPNNQKVPSQE